MYRLKKYRDNTSNLEFVTIQNDKTSLTLCNDYGAAISKLILNGKTIISTPEKVHTPHTYASSILFPFANRIENGTYAFNGETYNLHKNEVSKKHAIHGLIYNKPFGIDSYNLETDKASITLSYTSKENEFDGFPFRFTIQLKYVITDIELRLNVMVKNLSSQTLPFSLGWHPYFYSESKVNRLLELNAKATLVNNKSKIPIGIKEEHMSTLKIDKPFDDCYELEDDKVVYKTEDYTLNLCSNSEKNYLQLFTPKNQNFVAIEYMTAPANCFNSNADLLFLKSGKAYSTTWGIQLI